MAFIIRDDDSLVAQWSGSSQIPKDPNDIVFQLGQVGGA